MTEIFLFAIMKFLLLIKSKVRFGGYLTSIFERKRKFFDNVNQQKYFRMLLNLNKSLEVQKHVAEPFELADEKDQALFLFDRKREITVKKKKNKE